MHLKQLVINLNKRVKENEGNVEADEKMMEEKKIKTLHFLFSLNTIL
jgi:DNA-binding FrmR family transcriptional regulator